MRWPASVFAALLAGHATAADPSLACEDMRLARAVLYRLHESIPVAEAVSILGCPPGENPFGAYAANRVYWGAHDVWVSAERVVIEGETRLVGWTYARNVPRPDDPNIDIPIPEITPD